MRSAKTWPQPNAISEIVACVAAQLTLVDDKRVPQPLHPILPDRSLMLGGALRVRAPAQVTGQPVLLVTHHNSMLIHGNSLVLNSS